MMKTRRHLSNCPGCPLDRDSFWISLHKVFAAITQFREILQIHGLQILMLLYLFVFLHYNPTTTMFDVKHLSVSQREMKHKQTSHSNIVFFFLKLLSESQDDLWYKKQLRASKHVLFVRLCGQGSGICSSSSACWCSSALLVMVTREASATCHDVSPPS